MNCSRISQNKYPSNLPGCECFSKTHICVFIFIGQLPMSHLHGYGHWSIRCKHQHIVKCLMCKDISTYLRMRIHILPERERESTHSSKFSYVSYLTKGLNPWLYILIILPRVYHTFDTCLVPITTCDVSMTYVVSLFSKTLSSFPRFMSCWIPWSSNICWFDMSCNYTEYTISNPISVSKYIWYFRLMFPYNKLGQ